MDINSEANQREESSEWFIKYLNRQGDWLEKTRGNLMVAATVIAGMSFQVMANPPGGVWQSDMFLRTSNWCLQGESRNFGTGRQ